MHVDPSPSRHPANRRDPADVEAICEAENAARIVSDELTKFEILHNVDHERLPVRAAAQVLGLTERQVWRLLKDYRLRGVDVIFNGDTTTSLRDGLAVAGAAEAAGVSKVRVLAELKTARERMEGLGHPESKASVAAAEASVAGLEADAALLQGANREAMLRTALGLFDDSRPVCETEFAPELFQQIDNAKLEDLAAVTKRRQALENQLDPIADQLDLAAQALKAASAWGAIGKTPIDTARLVVAATTKALGAVAIRKLLPIEPTKEALESAADIGRHEESRRRRPRPRRARPSTRG